MHIRCSINVRVSYLFSCPPPRPFECLESLRPQGTGATWPSLAPCMSRGLGLTSGSWWWTGRPGMLRFMGSQRVGHIWAAELNWTELSVSVQPADFCKGCFCPCSFSTLYLKRYSWRTLFFLIALSSPCSLRTSFPSSRLQSLADTNPVLSLPTWDLELTFY